MVEPTIWQGWEGREGGSREKSVRQDRPMVEPTIWPAWGERRRKQGEECKTRQTYGRTNHLARLGGEKAETGMREEDKTDLW
ncbi:hypothetical protein DPMN_004881 [Dreissena polymorpha]|uniref:Uncharacterized protein n=1 Tax=Dreissena polymorpha TaxID=45954 RepID=A0A9D4MSF0_DREPO|nr:hypothetical protein DPMN_004881 [Dreissena polymorpha]